MKQKTKIFTFQLEVTNDFKPYDFYIIFKKIQHKGFFKNVLSVKKLDENGQAKEFNHKQEVDKEEFILMQSYGVK